MRSLKRWHKWLSLIFSLLILLFSLSGIILNHRQTFSSIDVSRKILPEVYRYQNWNLAAIKGSLTYGNDSLLIYGNIGIWVTDNYLREFREFNSGFPEGVDNRKINTLATDVTGKLYAGSLFGLFTYNFPDKRWEKVPLPEEDPRVVKVLAKGDSLLVMTRSNLFWRETAGSPEVYNRIPLPHASDDDHKTGLFKTLWVIHSGEIYGIAGKILVDLVGTVFILITLTGLVFFFMPYFLKRVARASREKWKRFNRFSLRWHNRLGSWGILVLILTTFTGMFLRPPLLIPIAGSRVGKIPFSTLDDPNSWHDRLRDLTWETETGRFILATSEGIYYSDDHFNSPMKPFSVQPPVSVMGITVMERVGADHYLVGSFSGLYDWHPKQAIITDHLTGDPWVDPGRGAPPFGSLTVAGYIKRIDSAEIIFDYAQGAMVTRSGRIIHPMTREILDRSPMSLWNFNLEVHTGRIFQPLMGDFYILVVPVVGVFTLVILITGFLIWWRRWKRRKAVILWPDMERS